MNAGCTTGTNKLIVAISSEQTRWWAGYYFFMN